MCLGGGGRINILKDRWQRARLRVIDDDGSHYNNIVRKYSPTRHSVLIYGKVH